MYETFFGLKRRPFLAVPDTESYFSTEVMEEARQSIEQTVRHGNGIALLFGASGTGKTLLLRMLRNSLETNHNVSIIANGRLESPKSFFQQLLYDLQLPFSGNDETELRLQLLNFARQEESCVILIDESQFLSSSVLEEIRLLMNCDNGSTPFFRVVLAGTVEFEEKLTDPCLIAFNQRVVCRSYLETLSREETKQYIAWQTEVSGKNDHNTPTSAFGLTEWIGNSANGEGRRIDSPHIRYSEPIFTENAKQQIFQLTEGLPRSINQLCDMTLQLAAERIVRPIDEHLVLHTWTRLQQITGHTEIKSAELISETVTPFPAEHIDEIVARKKATFQPKTFDSAVEFGTLNDAEPVENDEVAIIRFRSPNEYKPPYPEDDHWEDDSSEPIVSETDKTEPDINETKLLPIVPQLNNVRNNDCSKTSEISDVSEHIIEIEENPLDFYDESDNEMFFSSDIFPRLRELPISEELNDAIEVVAEAVAEKNVVENVEAVFDATENSVEKIVAENIEAIDAAADNVIDKNDVTEETEKNINDVNVDINVNIIENVETDQTVTDKDIEKIVAENIEADQTNNNNNNNNNNNTESDIEENTETNFAVIHKNTVTNENEKIEQNTVRRQLKRIYPRRRQRVGKKSTRTYRRRIIVSTGSVRIAEASEQFYCPLFTVFVFLTFRRFDSGKSWIGNHSFYPTFISVYFSNSFRNETVISETAVDETITNETEMLEGHDVATEEIIVLESVATESITIDSVAICSVTSLETDDTFNNELVSDEIIVDLNRKNCLEESEMDKETLEKYGAEVLEGRPPFVRKEPNYAYQTTDSVPEITGKVSYPDPVTGNVILLNWINTEQNSENGFGTPYREFLTREMTCQNDVLDQHHSNNQQKPLSYNEWDSSRVVRVTLNQFTDFSQSDFVAQNQTTSLDELFDEIITVTTQSVSLKEPSNRSASPYPVFLNNYSLPAQIEAAVKRITKAAEKIELAAEQSKDAGRQIKQAAGFVETEIKTVLPTYVELFRELAEFQQTISNELNTMLLENQTDKEPTEPRNRHERPVRLLPFPVRANTGSVGAAQFVSEIKETAPTDAPTSNEKSIDFKSLFQ
ncbi:MAG: AAA family ATPase [Planctomycetaceae bacterium]|jgi:type II secretory pathway predicted ATPase ExeA|nr:AAA family ATPase [Planctomycetaceae bacterium]